MDLAWDAWVDLFAPIRNPLREHAFNDDKYSEEQYQFETFGEELEKLQELAKGKQHVIWTEICEGADGCIIEGMHSFNRMLYYLTEVAYIPTEHYAIDEYKWI